MSAKHTISIEQARRLALHAQWMGRGSEVQEGKAGTLQLIEHLGYVQVDPMAVVVRAQHHTLWSRQDGYQAGYLHELQSVDRTVFEHWGHCASCLPMCDYRYSLPRMESQRNPTKKWPIHFMNEFGYLMEPVLERLRNEGPLSLGQLEDTTGERSKGWSRGSPVQGAVDILCGCGDIMVTKRQGLKRIFDLRERVIPEGTDVSMPTPEEQGHFCVRRALNAHGVMRERTIKGHLLHRDKKAISHALSELVDAGTVVETHVEGVAGKPYFVFAETLARVDDLPHIDGCFHIPTPFDNLIIHRQRIQELFGFAYILECYKPKHKRTYGYYVLPLLWNEDFVGRIDVAADRKQDKLLIKRLMFEPAFKVCDACLFSLAEKLKQLAAFAGCSRVEVVDGDSARNVSALRKRLKD